MLSLTEIKERLDPLHPLLIDCHVGAATRLRELAPASLAALNATERANFLHAQVRALVSVAVETVPGVSVTEWNIDTLAVGGDLLVRFKYLGQGQPQNVATEQQTLLARQQYTEEAMEILAMSGISTPPTMVTCGYTLDGLHIGRVMIRRDCKFHGTGYYEIYGGTAVTEHLTFPNIAEVAPAVVRSKRQKERPDAVEDGEE